MAQINIYLFSGLIIAIGLSGFLLISRKKSWCTNTFRFSLTGLLFTIGLLGLMLFETKIANSIIFLKLIQIPFINSLLDRFFKLLSIKMHDRDLLLYVRGSPDLDNRSKNPKLKTSDYLFSILLVIFIMTLPVFYVL